MCTVQNKLDVLHKAVHKFQCLCCRRLSLLLRQPVQSLQHRFHVITSKELLPKFLCIALCYQASYRRVWGSLSRPCFACCIAREMVESNSVRIFTMIAVIAVVDGIFV